jgi:hypothetical protein
MIKSRAKKQPDTPRRRHYSDPARMPAAPTLPTQQYRRNQTLSGIKRPVHEPLSARAKMHALARRRRTIGAVFGLVLFAIILLGTILTQFTGQVAVVGSSEPLNRTIEPTIYEEAINEYLGLHPVERLRFVLDEGRLSSYVSNTLPEVLSVNITNVENVVDAKFTLSLRKPVAGWQINGRQYYVDKLGVVFEHNYYAAPTVQIVDQSGVSPEQGSTVASARLLSFVGKIVSLSGKGSYTVSQAILPSGTTRELEIQLKNVQPYIKFSIDRGAGVQVEDMVRSLSYLKANGTSVQYLDVRVAGRAVYR